MTESRICYESASAEALDARRGRIAAWAAEMQSLTPKAAEDLARQFDQDIEFEPYATDAERDQPYQEVAQHLNMVARSELEAAAQRLPVFTAAAREVIQLAWEPETCLSELETLAKSDPVLAGDVMSSANSCRYAPRQAITDIRRALAHLGCDESRMVLLAAAMRKNFNSPRFRDLWEHCVLTAQAADRLARRSGLIPPGEAFLSGLVHDVGRLAFLTMSGGATAAAKRLTEAGCPLAAVERAVFGIDHCELGGRILAGWRFPEKVQEAAKFHHCPERAESPHAALVYLSEFRGNCEEALPSLVRLRESCTVLKLDFDEATAVMT